MSVRAEFLPREPSPLDEDDAGLEQLKQKIQRERGFGCEFYKNKCLRRRITVRVRARGQESFAAYAALLDRDPAEYDRLLDTLTINVTKFFRNAALWSTVDEEVIPWLCAPRASPHRIWSAGSASGEEAYTVSILLLEWAARNGRVLPPSQFQIVGTDIDRRSLEAARAAEYPELSMLETPSHVRERWFSPGPPYRLRDEVKTGVRFLRRDLISDEPEPGQSLILCRNVIIYFSRELQERLFQRFLDALIPGGYLVLGKVETLLGPARAGFRPVNSRERVFQKIA